MARFIRGAANAYLNQLNWQSKHRRDSDVQDGSLLGMGTFIPTIQNGWNHVMFLPALAKGFVFGAEVDKVPDVDVPKGMENEKWIKDQQATHRYEQEANRLTVRKWEDQIMGVLTLNLDRFNRGLITEEALRDVRAEADVLLPYRADQPQEKPQTQGKEVNTPHVVPNIPQEVPKGGLSYSTAK
ncbi:MAG: hypothetical protein EAY65_05840 [Alphaproteobacteria bacterium]|nr:MAG: hypothetical protein EAY65_05840 [Alphaproteobacteria bacterium]